MKGIFRAVLLAAAMALGACASTPQQTQQRAEVLQAPPLRASYVRIKLIDLPPGPPMPEQMAYFLEMRMRERLYRDGIFFPGQEGQDLTMRYSVVRYDPGDRSAREHLLGKDGTGTIVVEAIYIDAGGATVARIRSTGVVTGAPGQDDTMHRAVQDAVDRIFDTMLELFQ